MWAFGINLMCNAGVLRSGLTSNWRTFMNKWGIGALLLGLFTFPGSGTLMYSVALVIAALLRRKMRAFSKKLEPTPENVSVSAVAILPTVDVLKDADVETKRLAVATLSRQGTPEAMQVLRQLLLDPQAEVRTDASIALTHLEERLSRMLNSSLEQWVKNPADRASTLNLVDQYYQYAHSNVLDEASQHFYLVKAYDLLQRVTAQGAKEADLWLKLAHICQRLNKFEEALQAVRISLQFSPRTSDAYLLAMELAFRLRDWDGLVAFASQGVGALPEASEVSESLQWWSTLRAQRYGEAVHA
jgi:tetratricopeptide (TPR) repeat protein